MSVSNSKSVSNTNSFGEKGVDENHLVGLVGKSDAYIQEWADAGTSFVVVEPYVKLVAFRMAVWRQLNERFRTGASITVGIIAARLGNSSWGGIHRR